MGKKDKVTDDRSFGPASPSGGRSKLGPLDIQQKEFRVSRFGGYKMRDVDEFLDSVTDSMSSLSAENDRLRAGSPPAIVGTPDLDDVSRQADEIIKRARDEAERIVAQAKVQAASGDGPQDKGAVNAFLTQEREFLQSLAGLVQGHAETVKAMSKASKKATASSTSGVHAARAEAERERTSTPTTTPPAVTEPEAPTRLEGAESAMPAMPRSASKEPGAASKEPGAGPMQRPMERPMDREAVEPTRVPEPETEADPGPEPTVRIEEPEPASVARSDGDEDKDPADGDRSLRDLFWGED